ncbi:MAG: hypothetical protein OEY49_19955, partial [Candidatus Heimdallarchaeota archaeon]|nr:hypothetical protein [Candidatus Heimdallarchaeota archaeon]
MSKSVRITVEDLHMLFTYIIIAFTGMIVYFIISSVVLKKWLSRLFETSIYPSIGAFISLTLLLVLISKVKH